SFLILKKLFSSISRLTIRRNDLHNQIRCAFQVRVPKIRSALVADENNIWRSPALSLCKANLKRLRHKRAQFVVANIASKKHDQKAVQFRMLKIYWRHDDHLPINPLSPSIANPIDELLFGKLSSWMDKLIRNFGARDYAVGPRH